MVIRAEISVEEEERRASKILLFELKDHLELANCTCDLLWRIFASFNEINLKDTRLSSKVKLVLGARLADDLRAVYHLCSIGYSVQACVVAASIFEVAHTVAFIGSDEERAKHWDEHDDPLIGFKGVKALVKENFKAAAADGFERDWQGEYDVYTQLCWMKHVNPLLQDFRDPQFWSVHGTLMHAPDTTEAGIRRSWLALERSSRLGLLAASSIALHDLPADDSADVSSMIEKCGVMVDELNSKAIKRWGIDRPFKGKW